MRRSRWHRLRRAPDPHPSSGKTISTGASGSRAALGSRPLRPVIHRSVAVVDEAQRDVLVCGGGRVLGLWA